VAQSLEQKGLIRKLSHVFGSNREQGIEFEVFPPLPLVLYLEKKAQRSERHRPSKSDGSSKSGGPSNTDGMKHVVSSSKEAHTQTDGVRVCSEFSLDACRQYATHLYKTGQGITNPGGYATAIYRSGEADDLMREFFKATPVDVSKCPECNGGGWIIEEYRQGNMVRCHHSKLRGEEN
jgi:hypothetical protein